HRNQVVNLSVNL
ncbi:hypothetical protein RRG08_030610, partial [Elysia crispata]